MNIRFTGVIPLMYDYHSDAGTILRDYVVG